MAGSAPLSASKAHFQASAHLHSTSSEVCCGTGLRSLKLISTVDTLGAQEILASSAVASSSADSICGQWAGHGQGVWQGVASGGARVVSRARACCGPC